MSVSTISQTVSVSDTAAVSYTDIEFDADAGEYVREVRVFAAQSADLKKQIFTLQIRSPTREGIEFMTPSLTI